MLKNKYEINRAIINLDFEDQNLAIECNREIERVFESEIIPEIRDVFSSIFPNDINFTLSSLEIDLTTINEKDIATELAKQIRIGLEESLRKKLTLMTENIFNNNEDEVLIHNSGLILFWPFLAQFFEQLELVKNNAFVTIESKSRAVYLLQYLVYGHIDFKENELVLNKLLVGMPIEEPLTVIDDLTEEEKKLATSLIYGLINNWEKVRSSTIEGLQVTFLQRDGALKNNGKQITLIVEKKGPDILMEFIPWNIATIKLPWMHDYSLLIDWV